MPASIRSMNSSGREPTPARLRQQARHLPNLDLKSAYPASTASGPPSPTLTATTQASALHFGDQGPRVVVTRADLRQSLSAFESLLSAAKSYRNAMLSLATATASFASALEECARQKGASVPGSHNEDGEAPSEKLMAASGLHHLMANHTQVLADSCYKSFEIPLLEEFDGHRQSVGERQALYEKSIQEKTRRIRDIETENMKNSRKKHRDLAVFRKTLSSLQAQVDDLDRAKVEYYSEVLEGEQDMWENIANKTSLIVRSSHELYDRVASKGTSDPILESMVQAVEDPFQAYGPPKDEARIFSILPPLGILGPSQTLARTSVVSSTSSLPDLPYSGGHLADVEDNHPTPNGPSPFSSPENSHRATPNAATSPQATAVPEGGTYFTTAHDTPRAAARHSDLTMIQEQDGGMGGGYESDEEANHDAMDDTLDLPGALSNRKRSSRRPTGESSQLPPVIAVG